MTTAGGKFPDGFPSAAVISVRSLISPELLYDRNRHGVARRPTARNRQPVLARSYSNGKLDVELVRPDEERRLPGVGQGGRIAVNQGLHVLSYVAPTVGRVRAQTGSEDRDDVGRSVILLGVEWRRLEGYGVQRRRGATSACPHGENGGRERYDLHCTRRDEGLIDEDRD